MNIMEYHSTVVFRIFWLFINQNNFIDDQFSVKLESRQVVLACFYLASFIWSIGAIQLFFFVFDKIINYYTNFQIYGREVTQWTSSGIQKIKLNNRTKTKPKVVGQRLRTRLVTSQKRPYKPRPVENESRAPRATERYNYSFVSAGATRNHQLESYYPFSLRIIREPSTNSSTSEQDPPGKDLIFSSLDKVKLISTS